MMKFYLNNNLERERERALTLLLEHFNFTTQAAQLQTRDKRKGDEGSILEKDLDL